MGNSVIKLSARTMCRLSAKLSHLTVFVTAFMNLLYHNAPQMSNTFLPLIRLNVCGIWIIFFALCTNIAVLCINCLDKLCVWCFNIFIKDHLHKDNDGNYALFGGYRESAHGASRCGRLGVLLPESVLSKRKRVMRHGLPPLQGAALLEA